MGSVTGAVFDSRGSRACSSSMSRFSVSNVAFAATISKLDKDLQDDKKRYYDMPSRQETRYGMLSIRSYAPRKIMDESQLANEIVRKIISDTSLWVAAIGLIGVIAGALLTILGNILMHWLKEKPQRKLDEERMAIVKEMLDDSRFPEKWRSLETLSAVIGANDEETKRLLVKAGARGSEKADGKWGLIKNHPFPAVE